MTESKVVFDKANDYEQKVLQGCTYTWNKGYQQSGGSNVLWSASSSVVSLFDVPLGQVLNFARSFLVFRLDGVDSGANSAHSAFLDIPPIRRMYLANRRNGMIVDLPFFQQFWKMTKNLITPTEKFASYPCIGIGTTSANAELTGECLFHNPSNALPATAPAILSSNCTKINTTPAVDNDTTFRRAYISECQYMTSDLGTNGSAWGLNCVLRLGKIPFSFFNVDRNFYATENLTLGIEWQSWDSYLFEHTAVLSVAGGATYNTTNGNPTITNMNMYWAMETNPSVIDSVKSRVHSSGLSMIIPYSTPLETALGTSTSGTITQKINVSHGHRVLRVISAERKTANTLANTCCFYNYNAPLTANFYTQINNVRVEPDTLSVADGQDYLYMRKHLKGCPLENYQEYVCNCPVYINDFSGVESLTEAPEKDLYASGRDLSVELQWSKVISTKTAVDTTCDVIIVGQKVLVSSPTGVEVV